MAKNDVSIRASVGSFSLAHLNTIRVRFPGQSHSCGGMILLFDDMLSSFADISHPVCLIKNEKTVQT